MSLINLNDINLLTNWNWWILGRPLSTTFWLWFAFIVTLLGIIIAIILSLFYRPKYEALKNLKSSWIKLFNYCAFSSLVVLFGRWQQLPILGMRLFHGIIVAIFILLGSRLLIFRLTKIKKLIKQESIENKLNKYLPR